jgi:ADP-ribose pyrophosphatase YjhB (NUDIX family)
MRQLKIVVHPDVKNLRDATIRVRHAARAIVLNGDQILMLYTERYHDYTLPGGGLNEGEDPVVGMIRELQEETGARNVTDITPFGLYEEFRPWHRDNVDVMYMISHCYCCSIDKQLGETQYEDYEVRNGMKPVWISVHDAIAHNEATMLESDKKGMSIERETFLLRLIAQELVGM